ncbi:MAG: hypothetical protein U1D33_02495 [bacterium]|nr:hypothetical protein [bacterium]
MSRLFEKVARNQVFQRVLMPNAMRKELYHNATQNAAIVDLSDRAYIDVKGADARKFLNGILTNNIATLQGATGCYACLCTPKGKMIADLYCYTCGDTFGIECSAALKPIILETLKKYIIFQKVELVDQSEKWGACGVIGPKAREIVSQKIPKLPEKNFEYIYTEWEGFKLWIICKERWGLPGFELWTNREHLPLLCNLPAGRQGRGLGGGRLGLPVLDKETQEILRIESATPLFGVDMDENSIPQEAGLYNALSFNKGCYVGQEIIARLEHRGHVGKKLVQIKLDGNTVPNPKEKIFSTPGDESGYIT